MMASLHDKLQSKYGNSDAIAMMVENMKLEMRKKTSRDDCLRLVGISVKEMADSLKLPDDTMMAGRLQYRCLSCNHSSALMHDDVADKVIHAGLSTVPSSVSQMFQPQNQLVLATYPNGRAGALRPLQRQSQAMIPSERLVTGTEDPSLARRQKRQPSTRAQTADSKSR